MYFQRGSLVNGPYPPASSTPQTWDPVAVLELYNPEKPGITCPGIAKRSGKRCLKSPARHKVDHALGILRGLANNITTTKAAESPELGKAANILLCHCHIGDLEAILCQWRCSLHTWDTKNDKSTCSATNAEGHNDIPPWGNYAQKETFTLINQICSENNQRQKEMIDLLSTERLRMEEERKRTEERIRMDEQRRREELLRIEEERKNFAEWLRMEDERRRKEEEELRRREEENRRFAEWLRMEDQRIRYAEFERAEQERRWKEEQRREEEELMRKKEEQRRKEEEERRRKEEEDRKRREDEERIQKEKEEARRKEDEERRREEERKQKEENEARERAFRERVRLAREKAEREAKEKAEREAREWRSSWNRYARAWNSGFGMDPEGIAWPVKSGRRSDVNEANVKLFFAKAPPDKLVNTGENRFQFINTQNKRWHTDKVMQRFGSEVIHGPGRDALNTVAMVMIELRQEAQRNR
ncbi:hypothetical protein Daesc_008378 [Daldinia eschscholtzii]|uniref:Uncharacterized protein n=1 Tax=Daldinia eschscholtzii TaxID=292717 RepID=A0AAX6MBM6_9PEZI